MKTTTTDPGVELRLVVPRSALPAPPVDYYSQITAHLLGLTPRRYLELLRRSGAPPVLRDGRLRLVKRDDMLDYLDRLRQQQEQQAASHEDLDDADKFLMSVGCAPKQKSA